MTTTAKLQRIAARCKTDIAAYVICENILSDAQKRALAGSRSTLAAIDSTLALIEICGKMVPEQCRESDDIAIQSYNQASAILSAWPDELL